jgi:hypothetical protein
VSITDRPCLTMAIWQVPGVEAGLLRHGMGERLPHGQALPDSAANFAFEIFLIGET